MPCHEASTRKTLLLPYLDTFDLLLHSAYRVTGRGVLQQGPAGADGSVAVDELVRAVNIATVQLPLAARRAADADRNEALEISDLMTAVGQALSGCREVEAK